MTYQTISVRKLTPVIGAEIAGVDLSKPLGNQTFQEIHDALIDNLVIFFRNQIVTPEQHKDFGRRFGELHVHPAVPGLEEHPEIFPIHADANTKRINGEDWHSDVSCDAEPPMGSILQLHVVPQCGGDTLFSNMYAAYDALSDGMKRFLAGLTAEHSGEAVYRGRYGYDDRNKTYPVSVHPVVRTHPVSGRDLLFVNSTFTTRIMELSRKESDAVLQFLFRHIETPEFQCRFTWQPNSIAFWDNRCAQHHAMWDYYPQTRHGHRVTVKGDKPFHRA
ncbi:MAG TPA: TauD/TfdA family dioxygenase [Stellaceae bacterium]|nr:TauD/TfdA family dioxygenase [Stellaceae bacterium]